MCVTLDDYINEYYENNAKKLHQVVDRIIKKFSLIIETTDNDRFYSVANEVCADIYKNKRWDGKQSFDGFLYSCLVNKIKSEITRGNREKRKADRNAVSLEKKVKEDGDSTIKDFLSSDFDIDSVIYEKAGIESDERIAKLLDDFSTLQKQIVLLKVDGYKDYQIKEKLKLSKAQYDDAMCGIVANRNWSKFTKNRVTYRETEEEKMDTMSLEIEVTDSYRTDKDTVHSLLDDVKHGYLDKTYVSQRVPFQWDEEQVNKFLSRVLNNQPIPEIIICETTENGIIISFLIDGLQRISYLQEFRENRLVCRKKGAEFTHIKYREFKLGVNGERLYDDMGKPLVEDKVFDIVGKKYSELPDFLQRRFDKFNITVTRFFNCTSEMIDYHLRNYNNHQSMTKNQLAITNISNDTVRKIKKISMNHKFFKDCMKCNERQRKSGTFEEVVARTMNLIYFPDAWKKETVSALKLVEESVTDRQFNEFENLLNRLKVVCTDKAKEMFTPTNVHIWIALFKNFIAYGEEDKRFIDFVEKFNEEYFSKKRTGESDFVDDEMFETFKSTDTKSGTVVRRKLNGLEELMVKYLSLEDGTEMKTDEEFISEVVGLNEEEVCKDMDAYNETLDDLLEQCVKCESNLRDEESVKLLLALVAWSYKNYIDLEHWLTDYAKTNSYALKRNKRNYYNMMENCQTYYKKKVG